MDTNTLSICTGYGGIELGLREVVEGIRTVCYVENEVAVCEILAQRIEEGFLDDAPIWTDLRTFDATAWRGKIHLLTGGFPCQPHSVAGKQRGADDPRELSGEVLRIADELGRPTLFLENVPRIRQFWWDNVRPRLQDMGYRVEECLVTAEETGAPHRRERIFMLCHQLEDSFLYGDGRRSQGLLKEAGTGRSVVPAATQGSGGISVADHDNTGDCSSRHGSEREGKKEAQERKNGSFLEPTGSGEKLSNCEHDGRHGTEVFGREHETVQRTQEGTDISVHPQRVRTSGVMASELPDPELKRAQVSLEGRHSGKQDTGDHGTEIIPLFPPGPSDTRGWEYVYSELPALIPSFCRVVNGNTPWVDPQLRAIGNGVVPAVAALAWRILSKRFIKED